MCAECQSLEQRKRAVAALLAAVEGGIPQALRAVFKPVHDNDDLMRLARKVREME